MDNEQNADAVIPPGRITADDVVYISGPMTGQPDANRKAFNVTDLWLRDNIGCSILNPARHPDGLEYGEYMRRAYRDLTMASAVVLLPGWETSRGAMAEVQAAGIMGLAVATIESVVAEVEAREAIALAPDSAKQPINGGNNGKTKLNSPHLAGKTHEQRNPNVWRGTGQPAGPDRQTGGSAQDGQRRNQASP